MIPEAEQFAEDADDPPPQLPPDQQVDPGVKDGVKRGQPGHEQVVTAHVDVAYDVRLTDDGKYLVEKQKE